MSSISILNQEIGKPVKFQANDNQCTLIAKDMMLVGLVENEQKKTHMISFDLR